MKKRTILILIVAFFAGVYADVTNYWYLTPTGAGTKNGASLSNAFDTDSLKKYLENGTVGAGSVVFLWGGSYTLSATINFSSNNGTPASPIKFIGVKATTTNEGANVVFSDHAVDTVDKPLIHVGSYQFVTGNYSIVENLKFVGDANAFLTLGTSSVVNNCVLYSNYSTPSNRVVLAYNSYAIIMNNYIISDSGECIRSTNSINTKIEGNIFNAPNNQYGVAISVASGNVLRKNIFNKIGSLAIRVASTDGVEISNNTFHKCKNDIDGTDPYGLMAVDNIHDSTTNVCYKFTTQNDINVFRNNAFSSSIPVDSQYVGIDTATVHKDYWKKTGDLKLNSSFTISDTTSPAYRAGYIGR